MPQKKRTPGRRSEPKLFRCTGFGNCDMVFTRSEHLARHARKHTGEKPFRCVVPNCDRMFSRFDNMMQHTHTHNRSKKKDPSALFDSKSSPSSEESTVYSPSRSHQQKFLMESHRILPGPRPNDTSKPIYHHQPMYYQQPNSPPADDYQQQQQQQQQYYMQQRAYEQHQRNQWSSIYYNTPSTSPAYPYPNMMVPVAAHPLPSTHPPTNVMISPTPSKSSVAQPLPLAPYVSHSSSSLPLYSSSSSSSFSSAATTTLPSSSTTQPDTSSSSNNAAIDYFSSNNAHQPRKNSMHSETTLTLLKRRLSYVDLSTPIHELGHGYQTPSNVSDTTTDDSDEEEEEEERRMLESSSRFRSDGIVITPDEFEALQGFGKFCTEPVVREPILMTRITTSPNCSMSFPIKLPPLRNVSPTAVISNNTTSQVHAFRQQISTTHESFSRNRVV